MNAMTDVLDERARQDLKWGTQNHPPHGWMVILMEEVGEAAQEVLEAAAGRDEVEALGKYRGEMVQVAAVALAAIECFDRNCCPKCGLPKGTARLQIEHRATCTGEA